MRSLPGAEGGRALCVTVTARPATVSVPIRFFEGFGLEATVYVTEPDPVPLLPAVTLIQELLLTAVHPQEPAVVTFTVAVPPPYPIDCDVGAMEWLHDAPLWMTVSVCPPMVNVPVRGELEVFAATE